MMPSRLLMAIRCLSYCFLALLLLSLPPVAAPESQTAKTQVLLQFKRQLKDPLNHLDNRRYSESPCNFSGVTCDRSSGSVTGIRLQNLSLSSEISPSGCALHSLVSLELGQNALTGTVPSELVSCSGLQFLNLSDNGLSGALPDLFSLRSLRLLDLSTNQFTRKFPSWVGNLTGLVWLGVDENKFDEGEIPTSMVEFDVLELVGIHVLLSPVPEKGGVGR